MKIDFSSVELIGKIVKHVNPLKLKEKISLNKKANLLYRELKPLVHDVEEFFNEHDSVSISGILKDIQPNIMPAILGEKEQKASVEEIVGKLQDLIPIFDRYRKFENFLLLLQKGSIINSWYYNIFQELRIDKRKVNLSILLLKTNALNSFLRQLDTVVREFNRFAKEIPNAFERVQSNYYKTRDRYNSFLTRYEEFLKKCQREVGVVGPSRFERLA